MHDAIAGIHHVTAIAGAAQRNLDFYADTLGLRLVKRTVNFDDPGTYHLYYGDVEGRPGSILTFFPWAGAVQGRAGAGMAQATAFAIPAEAMDYWTDRLAAHGVAAGAPAERFGEAVIRFKDPDDLPLELVAHAGARGQKDWPGSPVPAEYALRSFHSVTLRTHRPDATARLLTDVFGYAAAGKDGVRRRLRAPSGAPGSTIDLLPAEDGAPGRASRGTVHHVAFRAESDEAQAAWRARVLDYGLQVTPVKDRQYFRSIYFREPGGVLFEIATDPPGFMLDEAAGALGTALKLPPWLEARRKQIEDQLPALHLPAAAPEDHPS